MAKGRKRVKKQNEKTDLEVNPSLVESNNNKNGSNVPTEKSALVNRDIKRTTQQQIGVPRNVIYAAIIVVFIAITISFFVLEDTQLTRMPQFRVIPQVNLEEREKARNIFQESTENYRKEPPPHSKDDISEGDLKKDRENDHANDIDILSVRNGDKPTENIAVEIQSALDEGSEQNSVERIEAEIKSSIVAKQFDEIESRMGETETKADIKTNQLKTPVKESNNMMTDEDMVEDAEQDMDVENPMGVDLRAKDEADNHATYNHDDDAEELNVFYQSKHDADVINNVERQLGTQNFMAEDRVNNKLDVPAFSPTAKGYQETASEESATNEESETLEESDTTEDDVKKTAQESVVTEDNGEKPTSQQAVTDLVLERIILTNEYDEDIDNETSEENFRSEKPDYKAAKQSYDFGKSEQPEETTKETENDAAEGKNHEEFLVLSASGRAFQFRLDTRNIEETDTSTEDLKQVDLDTNHKNEKRATDTSVESLKSIDSNEIEEESSNKLHESSAFHDVEQKTNERRFGEVPERSTYPVEKHYTKIHPKDVNFGYDDVTDGVKKRVIKPGYGNLPRVGDIVSLHCVGYLDQDPKVKFWDTRELGQRIFSFAVGKKQVIKGFDEGAASMRMKEVSEVKIEAKKAYGKFGFEAWDIPPDASILMEFEMIDIKRKRTLY